MLFLNRFNNLSSVVKLLLRLNTKNKVLPVNILFFKVKKASTSQSNVMLKPFYLKRVPEDSRLRFRTYQRELLRCSLLLIAPKSSPADHLPPLSFF